MRYCPTCEAEYEDAVVTCIDCGVPLITAKPGHCPFCEERLEEQPLFCPHCGLSIGAGGADEEAPHCETHGETDATGMCVVCGKLVCDACAVGREGKIFCDDDSHIMIHQDYALVYQTATEYEAAMIRSNLEGAGIEARIFSQLDRAVLFSVGNLAVVNIMVPKSQAREARDIITSIQSETGETAAPEETEGAGT